MGAGGVQCGDDGRGDSMDDVDWHSIGAFVLLSGLCVSGDGWTEADPDAGSAIQIVAGAGGCRGRIYGGGRHGERAPGGRAAGRHSGGRDGRPPLGHWQPPWLTCHA